MKTYLYRARSGLVLLFLLWLSYGASAQSGGIYNKSTKLVLNNGALIHIEGNYQHDSTALLLGQIRVVDPTSIIQLTGDFRNYSNDPSFEAADRSTIRLIGQNSQAVGGLSPAAPAGTIFGPLQFYQLELDNPTSTGAAAIIGQPDIGVQKALIFTQGDLQLDGFDLQLRPPAGVSLTLPTDTSDVPQLVNESLNHHVLPGPGKVVLELEINNALGGLGTYDLGKLGATVVPSQLDGDLTLARGEETQSGANGNSVARYFETRHAGSKTTPVRFHYRQDQLGALNPEALVFFRSDDSGGTWQFVGADTLSAVERWVEKNNLAIDNQTARWTLFECLGLENIDLGSDTAVCAGSSLLIDAGPGGTQYLWSNGETTQSFTLVDPNPTSSAADRDTTISVAVIGNNDCVVWDTLTVTFTRQPSLDLGRDTLLCADATYTLDGGSLGDYYLWSTGETSQTIQVNFAGTYALEIGIGECFARDTVEIQVNPQIALATFPQNVACKGDATGRIDALTLGGTEPFRYEWSQGINVLGTGDSLVDLEAGNYTLTVTDAIGCQAQELSIGVGEPDDALVLTLETDDSFCGGASGAASAQVSGGILPYSFRWSTGATAAGINQLAAGNYTITLIDGVGCERFETASISDEGAATITVAQQRDISCFGFADGQLELTVTGGTAPLDITWNNGASGPDLNGLPAGNYAVSVTGADGCVSTDNFTLTEPTALLVSSTLFDEGCTGTADGKIALSVRGGTAPYQYFWSNGSSQAPPLTDLAAGAYSVEVRDAQNCLLNESFVLDSIPHPLVPRFLAASPVFAEDSVFFVDVSFPMPNRWFWNFDVANVNPLLSSSTSLAPNPIFQFPEDPSQSPTDTLIYLVQLTVATESCVDSILKPIRIINEAQKKEPTVPVHEQETEEIDFQRIVAYPNPTDGNLTVEIELSEVSTVTLSLMDLQGRRISEERLRGSSVYAKRMELAYLPEGVYLIRAQVKDRVQSLKIIIAN